MSFYPTPQAKIEEAHKFVLTVRDRTALDPADRSILSAALALLRQALEDLGPAEDKPP